VAQLGSQRLKSDDYTAFPFGCGAEGVFDRYCSDGTFDFYDYRSIGEARRQNAAQLELKGRATTGSVRHDLSLGVLRSTVHNTLPDYAYNWVGTGQTGGSVVVATGDPTPIPGSGARIDERSLELSVRDAMHWSDRLTTWLGLRHTQLDRGYTQSLSTPWAAVSYKLDPAITAYASWGQGIESKAVPNNAAIYDNAGAVLPALKSRQWEFGVKGARDALAWQLAWFDIHRPVTNLDYCSINFVAHCVGQFDGTQRHRGLEASVQLATGPWRLGASAMLLHARRDSAIDPASSGRRPINVPANVVRAFAAWKVPGVPGLELQGSLSHEGDRAVLADNSIMLPAWTRLDAALRYESQVGRSAAAWTLGVDNLTDKRYWRESPYQFGHVYLYPGAPRTVRAAVTFTL
jgi:iron complex outermembrane receptor protein